MWIFTELKRRNVLRVGVAYLVGSWLLIQVAETIFPLFGFNEQPARAVVVVLAIGFPLALIFSWIYELTPEGLMLERNVNRSQSMVHHTGKRLDHAIIITLALALGYFAVDKFVLDPTRDAEREHEVAEQARSGALLRFYGEKSIAVLPFVNMSDDASNEYFSDGLSEELLNLLAKIPELRVTSRTSAFVLKGQKISIPEVAKLLKVAYVLEGSVRKAGNKVRVTAQLIEAQTDTHLWSETYDRNLDDVFAIQDEIGAAVVAQLKITLLNDAPMVRKTDPEAYELFLQGRHLLGDEPVVTKTSPAPYDLNLRGRNLRLVGLTNRYERTRALLEQTLAIDPDYAAAWAGLANVYASQTYKGLRPEEEGYALAREAANRALALDSEYAPAHSRLGWIAMNYDYDLVAAARHYERALAIEPSNTDAVTNAATLAAFLGRLDQAIVLAENAVVRDPVNPTSNFNLGLKYLWGRRLDEALASFRTTLTFSRSFIGDQHFIGMALLLKGEPELALESMQNESYEGYRLIGLAIVHHALGENAASDAALAKLIERYQQSAAYNIAYVLAFRGEADRAFEWLNKAVAYNDPGLSEISIESSFDNIKTDPRWLPFLESIGKSPEQLAAIEFNVTLPE